MFTIWHNWKIIECSLISYQTAAGVGCLESVGVSLILWPICFKSFEIRQRLREPSSLLVFSKEQVTQPMQWQGHLQIRACLGTDWNISVCFHFFSWMRWLDNWIACRRPTCHDVAPFLQKTWIFEGLATIVQRKRLEYKTIKRSPAPNPRWSFISS